MIFSGGKLNAKQLFRANYQLLKNYSKANKLTKEMLWGVKSDQNKYLRGKDFFVFLKAETRIRINV